MAWKSEPTWTAWNDAGPTMEVVASTGRRHTVACRVTQEQESVASGRLTCSPNFSDPRIAQKWTEVFPNSVQTLDSCNSTGLQLKSMPPLEVAIVNARYQVRVWAHVRERSKSTESPPCTFLKSQLIVCHGHTDICVSDQTHNFQCKVLRPSSLL